LVNNHTFMSLKQDNLKIIHEFKEFTIFVSLRRPSSRPIHIVFRLFGLATEPRSSPTGLFYFGYLQDSRAKDLCLSLASGDASLRGLQGNHQDDHWCRSQKGRGGIRGSYTTQALFALFLIGLIALLKKELRSF
jgi:hypothetical protein